MNIDTILESVRDAIIAKMPQYNNNNCSIADEVIFDYLQRNIPSVQTCCMVDYAGFNNIGKSEFSSSMINHKIVINVFFLVLNQNDYVDALAQARAFVDKLIEIGSQNSTLGNSVLRFKVDNGTPPLSYSRSSYNYIFMAISASVVDNVS